MFYEDLKNCLMAELVSLASFFSEVTGMDGFSFCCALKNAEGDYHRKYKRKSTSELYNASQIRNMNNMIRSVAKKFENKHPTFSKRLLQYLFLN